MDNRTILVVDDEPAIGKMITRFLGKHNYRALYFTGASAALACLAKEPAVDLLLTDMQMPEMSGLELTRQAKSLYPALPVIVMSGSVDGPDRDEIFGLGADFIPKPFDLVDLLSRIQ